MEQELLKLLIQGGTATTVIVGLIIFVKVLTKLISVIKSKNGNNQIKRIDELDKKINNEYLHDISEIRNDINQIQQTLAKHGERLARLETKIINGRK